MALAALLTTLNVRDIKESISSWPAFARLLSGKEKNNSNIRGGEGISSDDDQTDNEPKVCPICLDEIDLDDMTMKCPDNGHFFHQKCLSEWLVYQLNPFEGSEGNRRSYGTCPICREELTHSASKLRSYLKDPNYIKDDRPIFDKIKFRLRMYLMFFFADRKTILRSLTGASVFLFGLFKGFTLKSWTFTQDVIYFTLPNRLRLVTTVGYLFGLIIRACVYLYEKAKYKKLS